MSTNNQQQQALHWLAVGKISDAAQQEVIRTGGQVVYVASEPTVTLVGIAHAGKGDLTFTSSDVELHIEVISTSLFLIWLAPDTTAYATHASVDVTHLVTSAEYEDMLNARTNAALEAMRANGVTVDEDLGDLGDHPF